MRLLHLACSFYLEFSDSAVFYFNSGFHFIPIYITIAATKFIQTNTNIVNEHCLKIQKLQYQFSFKGNAQILKSQTIK